MRALMLICFLALLGFVVVAASSAAAEQAASQCPTCITDCSIKGGAREHTDGMFPIKIVSDMDKKSKVEDGKHTEWRSLLKSGTLARSVETGEYSVTWGDTEELRSKHSYKERGMELSELLSYNGHLLSFDDTTGIVYRLSEGEEPVPWVILADGAGNVNKGFKCEWATIKGGLMYVGSMGKEWTHPKTGEVVNHDPQFVKVVAPDGSVTHVDWAARYNKMRKAAGTDTPGYMIHESGNWHEGMQKWVFLPRRMSAEQYNDDLDEERAANKMILANEDFTEIEVKADIGPFSATRGFSSFKFIPGHPDEFVALKSEEHKDIIRTFITVLKLDGTVLMPEQHIDDIKFEGLEIF